VRIENVLIFDVAKTSSSRKLRVISCAPYSVLFSDRQSQ